ncbi:hypothetical protein SSPNP10_22605 [Streptomyces sp. NP10]|nr:hypothetical protein SSPNP10_22605 [Streptomyces sp. NP10]
MSTETMDTRVPDGGRAAEPPSGRQAWATTWLLLAFMLVNFADKAVLGLAGPEIMKEFGLSRGGSSAPRRPRSSASSRSPRWACRS